MKQLLTAIARTATAAGQERDADHGCSDDHPLPGPTANHHSPAR